MVSEYQPKNKDVEKSVTYSHGLILVVVVITVNFKPVAEDYIVLLVGVVRTQRIFIVELARIITNIGVS